MRSGRKVCKSGEMVSRCRRYPRFPPKPNYYFLAKLFLEMFMHIHSVVFALSRQINKQKICENNLSLLQRHKSFCKISSSTGVIPKPSPCLRSCQPWHLLNRAFNTTRSSAVCIPQGGKKISTEQIDLPEIRLIEGLVKEANTAWTSLLCGHQAIAIATLQICHFLNQLLFRPWPVVMNIWLWVSENFSRTGGIRPIATGGHSGWCLQILLWREKFVLNI